MKFPFFRRRRIGYAVSPLYDEDITPEETLVDAASVHSDVEEPIGDGIFRFVGIVVVLAVGVLVAQTFRLSIVNGDYFTGLAFKNKTVNFTVPPARGIIFDQSGTPLVENVPSFDVLVVSRELPRDEEAQTADLAAVAHALGVDEREFTENVAAASRAQSVFFAATDVDKAQVLALRSLSVPGVYVITSSKRHYLDGKAFSAILGYTGKVNQDDMADDGYYLSSDTIGRLGIELSYERELRGTHGLIFFSRAGGGDVAQDPTPGDNVVLNIDADAQHELWSILSGILREAGLSRAAAVVQDPRSGAVLSLVSFPSYDNNALTGTVSQAAYEQVFENPARPLLNRVIGGRYNPGSTIKPFIGLTSLQEGIMSATDTIQDCISITIPNPLKPDEPYIFRNWRADTGLFDLKRAIANSCNVYFATVGGGHGSVDGLGVTRIMNYLHRGLADVSLGIDLPGEVQGFLPTPSWKLKTRKENWYQGDTYNVSIGQGDLLVTPLWINTYVGAIANGGTLYTPQVAAKVVDADKQALETFAPTALGQLPFDASAIRTMQSAMRETVLTGTAKLLQNLPVSAAAKTGTAEVVKGQSINSLFTAFAPATAPEVAITVLVEGSESNQGYAIRAADQFLAWYFAREASPTPTE